MSAHLPRFTWLRVATTLALTSSLTLADVANRNLLPIGERESTMANAGITSASAGAVFYNPANLSRLRHPTLSLTGTTLLSFQLEADAIIVRNGNEYPYEASGFMTIPTSLVSTYRWGGWSLATSILVPDAVEVQDRTDLQIESLKVTTITRDSQQELWAGVSASRNLSSHTSLGFSVFAVRAVESGFAHSLATADDDPDFYVQDVSDTSHETYGLTAVVGLFHELAPSFGMGVRTQLPLLHLAGTAKFYESLVANGSAAVETERTVKDPGTPMPWDVGVGLAYTPSNRLGVAFDLNAQMPLTYEEPSGVDEDRTQKLELALRGSLGGHFRLTRELDVQLGVTYNASAVPAPQAPGDVPREDYWGLTGGVSLLSGRTRTGLGAFWIQSNGTLVPEGAPAGMTADVAVRGVGALITVSYDISEEGESPE